MATLLPHRTRMHALGSSVVVLYNPLAQTPHDTNTTSLLLVLLSLLVLLCINFLLLISFRGKQIMFYSGVSNSIKEENNNLNNRKPQPYVLTYELY